MSVQHIVVVNFTRMGDLVQSGPFLRSLKVTHPAARLTTVVFNAFADVARRLPMVDDVIVFDVDRWVPLLDGRRGDLSSAYGDVSAFLNDCRLMNADIVYNLAHTPQSAALCALMLPRRSFGRSRLRDGQMVVNGEWFNYLFSVLDERRLNPFNLVEIYLRANEGRSAAHSLELRLTDEDRRSAARLLLDAGIQPDSRYVVLQPGASSLSRQWPPAHFARLASQLHGQGFRVVVVGSSAEMSLSERIVSLSQQHAVSLAGQTDVGSLAAVLEGSHRLVSNDTGTIHLAAAVGTSTVGIYLGPAAAKDTAPYGTGHIVIEADLPCAPCGYRDTCQTHACQRQISVDDIFCLCAADEPSLEAVAQTVSGARVYRTQVDERGRFSLKKLNSPRTAPDFSLLSFYRAFWDRLLDADDAQAGLPAPTQIGQAEWRQGVESLRTILESAERWLFALLDEARRPALNIRRLSTLLQGQTNVHGELGRFLNDFPTLAPIARYLLVRLSSVRSGNFPEHLEDMSGLIADFEKALTLLTTVSPVSGTARRAHVGSA
jgi:ADP-heptose:LPS heptosyltransferase